MNTAHQHAANADDFLAQGLLIPASEEHYKAAEAFEAAMERTSNDNTKRTLQMLHNDHCKAGKELQRKIMKLREENKDPTLPQKPEPPIVPSNAQNYNLQSLSSPAPSSHHLSESQNRPEVDESFMLLGGQRSDPGDAFNQFWKIMEGMMDKLSQPVAFATAPLTAGDSSRNDGSVSSDTDIEDPMASRATKRIGMSNRNLRSKLNSMLKSRTTAIGDDFVDDFSEDGFDDDGLSESFCLVPSGAEPTPAALKRENLALKLEVEAVQRRLAAAERVLQLRKEQDQQLKDSIIMARREAHRVMGASTLVQRPAAPGKPPIDLNNLPPVPVPPTMGGTISAAPRDRDPQHLRRIRELEEEVRTVKAENEKQKAMIVKFRERWEKLKESAKRKKDAKAAANAASAPVRERIDEDVEGELEGESKELSNPGSEQ